MSLIRICLLLTLGISCSWAKITKVPEFTAALEKGAELNRPVAVLIHGASWHPLSKRMLNEIWDDSDFQKSLKQDYVLTHIDVPQGQDGEQRKAFDKAHEGWNRKTISSYPAVQLFASDGTLLKTYQGKQMVPLSVAETLAAHMDGTAQAISERDSLLGDLKAARAEGDQVREKKLLLQRAELDLNPEPKFVEQLAKADPGDQSGMQAKLKFQGWNFLRAMRELSDKGEFAKAHEQIDALLALDRFTRAEKALIMASKGRVLVGEKKPSEAWQWFQKAVAQDPYGPDGKAIQRYAERSVPAADRGE